jgi:hypothetical protein
VALAKNALLRFWGSVQQALEKLLCPVRKGHPRIHDAAQSALALSHKFPHLPDLTLLQRKSLIIRKYIGQACAN